MRETGEDANETTPLFVSHLPEMGALEVEARAKEEESKHPMYSSLCVGGGVAIAILAILALLVVFSNRGG